MVIQLSKTFRNPYLRQITKKEPKVVKNPITLNIETENYLLKKPREGKAFIPGGSSNIKTTNDLSFIPIEKMIIEEPKSWIQNEKLFEIPTSSDLFSIDTKPLNIEDIGESVERKRKSFKEPLRYYGLKMKKIKPNPNRKLKKEHINMKKE